MQTLDVLAEWLSWRGITFSRMDGQTNPIQRELDVRDFNADGSPTKVFLISTRAGGVGINLASADVVILFDSDWNPQVDLQVRVESPMISHDLLRELLDLPPPPRPHPEPLQPRPCCMHCDAPDLCCGMHCDTPDPCCRQWTARTASARRSRCASSG